MKKRVINSEYIRINNLANSSDEALEMFKDTPIFILLKQRREYARTITNNILTNEHIEIMNFFDSKVEMFFNLKQN